VLPLPRGCLPPRLPGGRLLRLAPSRRPDKHYPDPQFIGLHASISRRPRSRETRKTPRGVTTSTCARADIPGEAPGLNVSAPNRNPTGSPSGFSATWVRPTWNRPCVSRMETAALRVQRPETIGGYEKDGVMGFYEVWFFVDSWQRLQRPVHGPERTSSQALNTRTAG